MEGEQQPVYEQYPQYKNVNGVNTLYNIQSHITFFFYRSQSIRQ